MTSVYYALAVRQLYFKLFIHFTILVLWYPAEFALKGCAAYSDSLSRAVILNCNARFDTPSACASIRTKAYI
jgi:hypothetical protein